MILLLTAFLLAATEPGGWVRVSPTSRPAMKEFKEACPLRYEVDVTAIVRETKRASVGGIDRLHCRGVTLSQVQLRAQRGAWSPVEKKVVGGRGTALLVGTRVSVPPGEDLWLKVSAELRGDDKVVASGDERIEGEAGGINWEDGVGLTIPLDDLAASSWILRMEINIEPEEQED